MKKATSLRHKKIKALLLATFFFSTLSAPAAVILVDFGVVAGQMPADNGGTYWNNIPQGTTINATVGLNLRSSSTNATTGIILNLTSVSGLMVYGSGGTTTPNITSIPAFSYSSLAYDYWAAPTATPLVFTLTGLSNAYTYQFTMFASRMAAGNKTSDYTLVGATTKTVSLDAQNNTSNVVSTGFLSPGGVGSDTFTFTSAVGAGNGAGYSYLGGLQIEYIAVPEPSTWALLSVGFGLLIFFHRRRKA